MRLEFIGAAHTVTGSCYLLESQEKHFLIDCGMFQGSKRVRELNYEEFPFVPADIEGVLLTHAHVDHCGLLPKLVREGFKGTIYATKSTCELCQIMLPDSAHIQTSDAELLNRKGRRRGDTPVQALYSIDDAMEALKHLSSVPYEKDLQLADNIRVVFRDAGHILGSAFLEVYVTENGKTTKLVFSGDIGQPNQPILKDPARETGADFLIVESTYGDRLHQIYDKETKLLEVVNDTMDRGGNLIIPSFAVGRTQTLLYYFYNLWKQGRMDGDIPIIIDSPLAIAATRVFLKNFQDFDEDALALFKKSGKIPRFPQVRVCETAAESRALNSEEGSAVIISASGMCDAGINNPFRWLSSRGKSRQTTRGRHKARARIGRGSRCQGANHDDEWFFCPCRFESASRLDLRNPKSCTCKNLYCTRRSTITRSTQSAYSERMQSRSLYSLPR